MLTNVLFLLPFLLTRDARGRLKSLPFSREGTIRIAKIASVLYCGMKSRSSRKIVFPILSCSTYTATYLELFHFACYPSQLAIRPFCL